MLPIKTAPTAIIAIAVAFLPCSMVQAQSTTLAVNIAPRQLWGQCSDGAVDKVFVNVTAKSTIGLDGVYIVGQSSYEKLRANYNGSSTTPPAELLRYKGQPPALDDQGKSAWSCEKVRGVRVRSCTIGTTAHDGTALAPKGVACLVVSNAVSAMAVPVDVAVTFGKATNAMTTGEAIRSSRYTGTLLLAIVFGAIVLAV